MELEVLCDGIVRSVFPDVELLKRSCIESGFIPSKYRGEVWSLLLNGGVLRDEESFDHTNERIHYREIHDSFSRALKIWHSRGSRFEASPHLVDEMSDILALFCKRMNLQFDQESDLHLCNILLPLLSSSPQPIPRSLASSCFYALCTSFLPLAPFQPPQPPLSSAPLSYESIKRSLIAEKMISWLRILLSYHFPSLAIHLDSIFPNWERVSTASRCGVFGESLFGDPVDSHKESGLPSGGLVPSAWIGGLFAGSFLSATSVLRLWDWCLLWDQKFASVYFTASLFGLHEELILKMTSATELTDWVQTVCRGGVKSFAQCKAFQAASTYCPQDLSLTTEPITPVRLFGDEFDDDDDFNLSSSLSHPQGPGGATHHTTSHLHSRNNTISVSIGWDDETDDQSDSGDEAAAAFLSQCAVPLDLPILTPQADPDATEASHDAAEEFPLETPDQPRSSDETFTPDITPQRLEELFLAGWIACTSRLMRNTPLTFQSALAQITEWATSRAREEYLSSENRRPSLNGSASAASAVDRVSGPVPVEYRRSDELDHSSHNWSSSNTPDATTRTRAVSSPMDYDPGEWKRGQTEESNIDLLEENLSPQQASGVENKSKFQLIVETSSIAAGYGKSIWGRMSLKTRSSETDHIEGMEPSESEQTSPKSQEQRTIKSSPNWRFHDHSKRMCLFTSAEEVLPCVCSTRRRSNVTSESLFLEAFQSHSSPSPEGEHINLVPVPYPAPYSGATTRDINERPFYFAVDCWPEILSETGESATLAPHEEGQLSGVRRICRIPKAFHMSYTAIVDPAAMTEMLSVLEPLAHVVHIVLVGLGPEIIQQHHFRKPAPHLKASAEEELETLVDLEEAQMGAMAMALMKHGFPHVSILEGGYSSVLRLLRNCDGCRVGTGSQQLQRERGGEAVSLGMHVLVDVDQEAVGQLFAPSTVASPSVPGAGPSGVTDLLFNTYGLFRRKQQPQSASQSDPR